MHTSSKFTRLLCALLALLCMLFCAVSLVACGGPQNDPKNHNDAPAPSDESTTGTTAVSEYTIVRGDSSGNPVLKQALNLRSLIRTQCGSNLPLTTDFTADEGQPEILVGFTNRKESIEVAKELDDSIRYIIRTVGSKIVILANTQNALAEAVAYFAKTYVSDDAASLSYIHHTCGNDSLVLYNAETLCSFVVPDNAGEEFIACAQSMLDSLAIPGLTLVRYSDFTGGNAVMLGEIPQDEISTLYASSVNEGEYIARSAAGHVYLQGYDELLTLTAFGDFLVDVQKNADKDLSGNRYLSAIAGYSFNSTWDFSVPKPFLATLDNSESITGTSHIFYYSEVSEHSFSLFKQMLPFFGYTIKPYTTNIYVSDTNELTLNYLGSDGTLSVLLDTVA